MIHNVTEGLGIATPVAKTRVTLLVLAGLALVAGAPTILGAWIGGYTSNDVLGALFFALAAGGALSRRVLRRGLPRRNRRHVRDGHPRRLAFAQDRESARADSRSCEDP